MKRFLEKFGAFIVSAAMMVAPFFSVKPAQAQLTDDSGLAVDISKDCADIAEDQSAPDPGNVFPPDFVIDWPPFIGPPFPTATYPLGHLDWKVNSFAEFFDSMGFINNSQSTPPEVKITAASFGSHEGDPITLMAQPTSFQTKPDQLDYAWWNVVKPEGSNEETLYSLNGVVAGGEPFTLRDKPFSDGTRCGVMTRKPTLDEDNDGMDDQWERRYSGKIGGLEAGADLDGDGYLADSFQDNVTLAPYRIVSNSQGQDAKGAKKTKFTTGDNSFDNLEEYIWGTNPTDPDTDDDGYPDEADVAGIGQMQLHYTPDLVAGQSQTVELDAMGETFLKGANENLVTQIVAYRSNIAVNLSKQLSIQLAASTQSPQLGEPFQVQANLFGTDAIPASLEYTWSITDGTKNIALNQEGAPCKLVSFGNIVECNFGAGEVSSGDSVVYDLDVFDPLLGEHVKASLSVPIGNTLILSANPTLVPQYPIDQTGEFVAAPAGNTELGERWVELTVDLGDGSPEDYNFDWFVDQTKMEDTCSSIPLSFSGKAKPGGVGLCGIGTNILYYHATSTNTHVYDIEVHVTNKRDGSRLADETLQLFTDPTPMPFPGQENGVVGAASQTQASAIQVQATPADANAQIVVHANNIETSPTNSYTYNWTVDGANVASSSQNPRELVFAADPDKSQYNISLQVIEKSGSKLVSQKTSSTVVAVDVTSKFDRWKSARLASVAETLYPLYHSIAGNTSLFLLLSGFVFIASVYFLQKNTDGSRGPGTKASKTS